VQYERLVREAWAMAWQHRFLWFLALFAGGASTFAGAGGMRPDELGPTFQQAMSSAPPELRQVAPNALRWINENLAIIASVILIGLVLVLIMVAFTCIFRGALTQSTLDLAQQHPASLSRAMGAGSRYVWRFIGLSLLFGLLAGVVIFGFFGIIGLISLLSAGGNVLGPALGAILALPLAIASLVMAVIGGIIFPYAERELIHHGLGPIEALWAGWCLLRSRVRQSLLIWFIGLVISVGSGVVIGIAFLVLAFVLVIPGALLWWALGPGSVTLGYIFVAGTAVFLLLFVMGAISNAFSWSYWSLGYLRMVEGEPVPAA
jgi:hypothetical protein